MGAHALNATKTLIAALVIVLLCAPVPLARAHAITAAEQRAEADAISGHIDSMQTALNEMKALSEKAAAEYEEAAARRDEAAQRIEEESARVESLQDRLASFAVSMYKDNGAATFLSVLLQTSSFHEFLTSWDRCTLVSDTGKALLEEEKAARAELEGARAEYEQQATRAEQQMKVAQSSAAQIEETQKNLREEVDKLVKEAEELERKEQAAEKEADADAKGKGSGKQRELTAEQAEKAEEERKAKEAEIAQRAQEAVAAAAAAAASAHAEAGALSILSGGVLANPCPTATESSGFGYRDFDHAFHKGLDMAAPEGTPYYAAESGTVLYATNDGGYNGGAGNWVVIAHGNGVVTKYMHSSATLVKPGDQVERGQMIGMVGNTGQSFGAHLHFQVEVDGVAVNPLNYL